MGRRKRRKKIIRRRPTIPNVFQCPHCGAQTLIIDIVTNRREGTRKAIVRCGTCHIYYEMDITDNPLADKAWVYGKFIDAYYEGRVPLPELEEGEE